MFRFAHMGALMLAIALSCSAVMATEASQQRGSDILELNEHNFLQALEHYPNLLVKFHVAWCNYCKALEGEYAKAAVYMQAYQHPVTLAQFDCTGKPEVAAGLHIRGFPTLRLYTNYSASTFHGRRTMSSIVRWTLKKIGPPTLNISNAQQLREFLHLNEVAIIGYFADPGGEHARIFMQVAGELPEHSFAICTNPQLFLQMRESNSTVAILKRSRENIVHFADTFQPDRLKRFVEIHSLPLIAEYSNENSAHLFQSPVKTFLLFFLSKHSNHISKYITPLHPLASAFRYHVGFMYVPVDAGDFGPLLDIFNIKWTDLPCVSLLQRQGPRWRRYKAPTSDYTPAGIRQLLLDQRSGKLKPMLESQKLPADWDEHPVKQLVSDNFEEVAFNRSQNVLVEFYAPWCRFCQTFVPIYDQLGEHYRGHNAIVIAKLDASANELDQIDIIELPTIVLFRRGDNRKLWFHGPRTLDNLISFVEGGSNSTAPNPKCFEQRVEL